MIHDAEAMLLTLTCCSSFFHLFCVSATRAINDTGSRRQNNSWVVVPTLHPKVVALAARTKASCRRVTMRRGRTQSIPTKNQRHALGSQPMCGTPNDFTCSTCLIGRSLCFTPIAAPKLHYASVKKAVSFKMPLGAISPFGSNVERM
jgi:hypothetical protein